jgi:large-conductance mechanosensitive channel
MSSRALRTQMPRRSCDRYGQFLTVAVNFLIVAAVLFLVIKAINTLQEEGRSQAHARRTKPT